MNKWTIVDGGDRAAAASLATAASAQTRGVTQDRDRRSACTPTCRAPAATYGVSSSNAVKMRFDEVNEAGGINGRKIKLIVEDTPVPGAARGAGRQQADQPRQDLRHRGRRSARR